ncbi:MAG: hypothetical protein AAFU64_05875 [Bacteroidota bacterium]
MKRNIIICLLLFVGAQVGKVKAQDQDLMRDMIDLISPIEVSKLIKDLNIRYDKSILNNPTKNYNDEYKRALNLGVFSTDLGYANINEANSEMLSYLNSVKVNADKLGLGNFINSGQIMLLGADKRNLNKLLEYTSETFEAMSKELQNRDRTEVAYLMLAGGWIEMLHITCQVAVSNPGKKELTDRIIEQQIILAKLLQGLQRYQSNAQIMSLSGQLSQLQAILSKYDIMNNSGSREGIQTTTEDLNGVNIVMVKERTASADFNVSSSDLNNIANQVSRIRNQIVN